MRRDPLIIGGGPAGAAAAIVLGRAGHRPVVIERSSAPADKVCGDFLSTDAIERIRFLGLEPAALGAMPIHRLRVIQRDRIVETPLPFPALGLSRRTLDAALLRRAETAGAVVRTGQTVRSLTRDTGGWSVRIGQASLRAETVFLATGKHDLRDWPRPQTGHGCIGMKMYLALPRPAGAALDGATELTLFPGGYAGLQPVESGKAVLCVAVTKRAFQAYGSGWSGLVAAIGQHSRRFAAVMAGAEPLLQRPLAIAGIPYGYRARAPATGGMFRLGDQAAVIPSLTGDGLAIALLSGQYAARAWMAGADAAAYQHSLSRALSPQMRLANVLHHLGLGSLTQAGAICTLRMFPGLLRQAASRTRLRRAAGGLGETPAVPPSAEAARRGNHRRGDDI